jgi:septal ring factor EnvC (AmiA/AmiB activator)
MKTALCFIIAALLATSLAAQTNPTPKAGKRSTAVTAKDLEALRDVLATQTAMLAAQQQQIQELKQEIEQKNEGWQNVRQQFQETQATAASAQKQAAAVEATTNDEKASVAELSTTVAMVKTDLTNNVIAEKGEQKRLTVLEDLAQRFRFTGDIRLRADEREEQDAIISSFADSEQRAPTNVL